MLSIDVAIWCPPIIFIYLAGRLLLGLRIFVALDGFFFLVVLKKVFVAQRLALCITDKFDLLAFIFVWQVDCEASILDSFDFLLYPVFTISFFYFWAAKASNWSKPHSLFIFMRFSVLWEGVLYAGLLSKINCFLQLPYTITWWILIAGFLLASIWLKSSFN